MDGACGWSMRMEHAAGKAARDRGRQEILLERPDLPLGFFISLDCFAHRAENLCVRLYRRAPSSPQGCAVAVGSSNRRPSNLHDKRVLLIDSCQATREVRASVLRGHGVEVHAATDFSGARFLWQPDMYDFVLLDVRRYAAGEVLEWCKQLKDRSPQQRIVFFVGAPKYLSLTWSGEVSFGENSSGQWGETVKRFLTAA